MQCDPFSHQHGRAETHLEERILPDGLLIIIGAQLQEPTLASGSTPLLPSDECYFVPITRVPQGDQLVLENCSCIDHIASDGCAQEAFSHWLTLPSDHVALFATVQVPKQLRTGFKKSTWTCSNPAAASEWAATHAPDTFENWQSLLDFTIRFQDLVGDIRTCKVRWKHREAPSIKALRQQWREARHVKQKKRLAALVFAARKQWLHSLTQIRNVGRF